MHCSECERPRKNIQTHCYCGIEQCHEDKCKKGKNKIEHTDRIEIEESTESVHDKSDNDDGIEHTGNKRMKFSTKRTKEYSEQDYKSKLYIIFNDIINRHRLKLSIRTEYSTPQGRIDLCVTKDGEVKYIHEAKKKDTVSERKKALGQLERYYKTCHEIGKCSSRIYGSINTGPIITLFELNIPSKSDEKVRELEEYSMLKETHLSKFREKLKEILVSL